MQKLSTLFDTISFFLGVYMLIRSENISIIKNRPIYFSHIIDNPKQSDHTFHLHDHCEIYIYISGDIDFIVDRQYVSLSSGDIVLTATNVIHKPIIKSSSCYERYYIGIPDDAFNDFTLVHNPLDCFNYNSLVLTLEPSEKNDLIALLKETGDLIENKPYGSDYLCYINIIKILHLLNVHVGLHHSEYSTRLTITPDLISNVMSYIKKNPSTVNNVNEIAEHFHVNSSYLSTLFSKSMNVTLKKYLLATKISYAKSLLSDGVSVSDAGNECGFCSTSHFVTTFKSITGQTPKSYKKSISQVNVTDMH